MHVPPSTASIDWSWPPKHSLPTVLSPTFLLTRIMEWLCPYRHNFNQGHWCLGNTPWRLLNDMQIVRILFRKFRYLYRTANAHLPLNNLSSFVTISTLFYIFLTKFATCYCFPILVQTHFLCTYSKCGAPHGPIIIVQTLIGHDPSYIAHMTWNAIQYY